MKQELLCPYKDFIPIGVQMEDDIFAQLANLISEKPTYTDVASGFGSASYAAPEFGDAKGYSSSDEEGMFSYDDMIVPDIKPVKVARDKKLIIVIDDDFSTLDLMKIYLQRDYEYKPFDDPKNAIFFLNGNIPDLIFVDCYLNTMNSRKLVEIIRMYKELAKVPIIYIADPSEMSAIAQKLPEGVVDIVSRPVKRGDLQKMLDTHITDDSDSDDEVIPSHDIIS